MRRWRGLKALVHDIVDRTTELVGEGHESTARSVMRVTDQVPPIAAPARAVNEVRRVSTEGVLASIRVVNRAVEKVSDLGLDLAETALRARDGEAREDAPGEEGVAMRSDAIKSAAWVGDAALGLVNAAVGDRLSSRKNGLDLGLTLRVGDRHVDPADREALARAAQGRPARVAIFVHGLATTEWSWCLEAEAYHGDAAASFGTLLQRDLGYEPVFVRYNTGRRVSKNGRALSRALDALLASWPVPIEEVVLIGHSMGGLVVRSACHYGSESKSEWIARVRRVFCLGSPHGGAPLEKVGNVLTAVLGAVDLPGTLVPARILEMRSAGIKDLRHGSLVDEDWLGRDPDALRSPEQREVPLLPDAAYYFVSATVTEDPDHPLGKLIGDLLVRVPSSAGHTVRGQEVPIETARFGGVMHHQLQNHPDVYEIIRRACAPRA